tara:strand:- start:14967 stop:15311 length:345 start_codon:yes stop_codon:yes gene_type:complete
MADGDFGRRGTSRVRGVGLVEPRDDFFALELRKVLADGVVKVDQPLLAKHHDAHRRDGLGHRGDREDGVRGHVDDGVVGELPERAPIQDRLSSGDDDNDARDVAAFDRVAQKPV